MMQIGGSEGASASMFLIFMILFYLIAAGIGLFVLYLMIRLAINHSNLSRNVEALKNEVEKMNKQLNACDEKEKR